MRLPMRLPFVRRGTRLPSHGIAWGTHASIKRQTRPILGFKSFWSAAITVAGIELMHMIRKGQLKGSGKSRPAHNSIR